MGTVYLAEDTRLHRKIALKVLPRNMAADPERLARFEREARAVAALNHPNIVTIYSVERIDDTHFLTMELVEGGSLSHHIPREGMRLDAFFELALPLTDAIHAAHEQGVTHRDLKPENVMVTAQGRLKILDFGLAKLSEPATPSEAGATMATAGHTTEAGVILGTVAYMSPEQAEGKSVDHRTDIFSMGILLYEMATGVRPFGGDTNLSTLTAILRDTPRPADELNRALPHHLGRVIQRCVAKDPARRYQTALDVKNELLELQDETGARESQGSLRGSDIAPIESAAPGVSSGSGISVPGAGTVSLGWVLVLFGLAGAVALLAAWFLVQQLGLPDWVFPGAVLLLLIGLPVLVATGLAQKRRGDSSSGSSPSLGKRVRSRLTWRRAVLGGVFAFALWGVVVAAYMVTRHLGVGPAASLVSAGVLTEEDRVLVAEFENRTGDPLLGDAIQEALAIDLARSRTVSVVPPDDVAEVLHRMERDPGTPLDVDLAREVAVRDGIKAVVSGQVNPAGKGYVLSVRLLIAESGEAVGAYRETADSDGDIIPAIDRLSRAIRENVGESLKTIRAGKPLAEVTTSSLLALQKYSQAVRASDFENDVEKAVTLLQEATELDTSFAMAFRKLAVVYGNAFGPNLTSVRAVRRAYEHRDRLPDRERHLTVAMYYGWITRETEKAISEYERLLDLDPEDTWAINNVAGLYGSLGDREKALALYRRADSLEASPLHLGNIASELMNLGRYEEAEAAVGEFAGRYSEEQSLRHRALLLTAQQRYDEAAAIIDRMLEASRGSLLETARTSWDRYTVHAVRGELAAAEEMIRNTAEIAEASGLPGGGTGELLGLVQIDLYLREDPERAAATLEGILADAPPLRPGAGFFNVARMYPMLGRSDEARALLDRHREEAGPEELRGAADDRASVEVMIALAEGRPDEALRIIDETDRSERFLDVVISYYEGLAHEAAGRSGEAIAAYEHYLETPFSLRIVFDWSLLPSALQRVARLHDENGDTARAVHYYARFADLWENADPELQPRVRAARTRINRLTEEQGS
jgi:tetratricopeptide (TPR) repeat protein